MKINWFKKIHKILNFTSFLNHIFHDYQISYRTSFSGWLKNLISSVSKSLKKVDKNLKKLHWIKRGKIEPWFIQICWNFCDNLVITILTFEIYVITKNVTIHEWFKKSRQFLTRYSKFSISVKHFNEYKFSRQFSEQQKY